MVVIRLRVLPRLPCLRIVGEQVDRVGEPGMGDVANRDVLDDAAEILADRDPYAQLVLNETRRMGFGRDADTPLLQPGNATTACHVCMPKTPSTPF